MAYAQDQFGMWYDTAEQAAAANRTAATNFNANPASGIDTGNRLTNSGQGIGGNLSGSPEAIAAYFAGNTGGISSAPQAQSFNNGKGPMAMAAPAGGSYGAAPYNGGGGGSSAMGGAPSGQNPYLSQMGDVMAGQMTQNFNRKVMPGIASQAMASGGFGGSRQGVIEANAMNDLNGQIGNALTNLYGQGFNTSLNYDLGLRNNDLGFAGLDAQINQNNFNNRLNGANFGLGIYDRQQQGNQAGINAGTNIQNTPMNYWSQFGNQYNSIGRGFNSTTGSTNQQGNPMMGALGGAQLGSRIASGMGGIGGSASDTQNWTYGGSGTNRGPSDNIDWIYG